MLLNKIRPPYYDDLVAYVHSEHSQRVWVHFLPSSSGPSEKKPAEPCFQLAAPWAVPGQIESNGGSDPSLCDQASFATSASSVC